MKLQANVDSLMMTYRGEFTEVELRVILRGLSANWWNVIATSPEEELTVEMMNKIRNLLPPASEINNVVPIREYGAVENMDMA